MYHELIVTYETRHLPPPFSFRIKATLQSRQGLGVSLSIEYTGREELTEEEIQDEGFTGNDDFEWTGALPLPWQTSLEQLLSGLRYAASPVNLNFAVTIAIDGGTPQHPLKPEIWEYWLQELQQGCLEAAKTEKPLAIDLARGAVKWALKASFEHREASVEEFTTEHHTKSTVSWAHIKEILKHIYMADYQLDDVLNNYDTGGDTFLHLGGEQWYNLSKAGLRLKKKKEWITQLHSLFIGLATDPSS